MSKQNRKSMKRKLCEKMQRYSMAHNMERLNPNLRKSIGKATTVSPEGIEAKIESLEFANLTESMLIANEDCFKPFIKTYCNKSGKYLNAYSLERFSDMLSIHGKEKTLSLLIQLSASNYSLEWMCTDYKTLNKLMIQDATGYFVYAASHFFELSPPKTQGKNLDFSLVPEEYKNKFLFLQDKIKSRNSLDVLKHQYLDLIIEANELMRRLLGLAKPTKSMLATFFTGTNLVDVCESKESLIIFIQDIKENIIFLLQRHFKNIRQKLIHKQNDLYKITSNDIDKIKRELMGLNQFHNQPSIKNQPKRVSIMLDLKEFIIDEFGDAELLDDLSVFDPPKEEMEILNNFSFDGAFDGLKVNKKKVEKQKESLPKKEKINLSLLGKKKLEKSVNSTESTETTKSTGFKLSF